MEFMKRPRPPGALREVLRFESVGRLMRRALLRSFRALRRRAAGDRRSGRPPRGWAGPAGSDPPRAGNDRTGNKALALSSFSFKVLTERRRRRHGEPVQPEDGRRGGQGPTGREISALEE